MNKYLITYFNELTKTQGAATIKAPDRKSAINKVLIKKNLPADFLVFSVLNLNGKNKNKMLL